MSSIKEGMIVAVLGTIFLGITAADAQVNILEKSYSVSVATCTSQGQLCEPVFSVQIETGSVLQVNFSVTENDCSPFRLHIYVDGVLKQDTGFLGWYGAAGNYSSLPLSTGFIHLGPISPGKHRVSLQAEGHLGGCNQGHLASWDGILVVRTS